MLRLDTTRLYASSTAASVPAPANDSIQDVPAANDSLPPPPPEADTVTLSDEGLARLRDDPPPPPRHDQEELEQTVASLEAELASLQQQINALAQNDDPQAQQEQASLQQQLGELNRALDGAQQKLAPPPEATQGHPPRHGPIAAYLAHQPAPHSFQAVPT